jgi:hypothetical protein
MNVFILYLEMPLQINKKLKKKKKKKTRLLQDLCNVNEGSATSIILCLWIAPQYCLLLGKGQKENNKESPKHKKNTLSFF